jgi:hypothetical protein
MTHVPPDDPPPLPEEDRPAEDKELAAEAPPEEEAQSENRKSPRFRSRRRVVIAVVIGVLAAGGAALYFLLPHGDEADVRTVVDNFVTAVDNSDTQQIVSLLCEEEAEGITEDDDADLSGSWPTALFPLDLDITEVQVIGDNAAAKVSRADQDPYPLYLRRDGGVWKVCADAEAAFRRTAGG